MTIERAEELKREWTDKFVTVRNGVPELRRFEGYLGRVRTVNMNCRVLVEFETPADISWYDIDPQFLIVTERKPDDAESSDKSSDASSTSALSGKASAPAPPAAASSAAAKPAVGSPLDAIRAQAGGAATAAPSAPKPASPLDAIRNQNAANKSTGASVKPDAGTSDVPATTKTKQTAAANPLDAIRAQNAAGSAASTAPESSATQKKEPVNSGETKANAPTPSATGSPLDQIRAQAEPTAPTETVNDSATAPEPQSSKSHSAPTAVDSTRSADAPSASVEPSPEFTPGALPSVPEKPATVADTTSPLDQIRRQAGETSTGETGDIFDQVRTQAEADDAGESGADSQSIQADLQPQPVAAAEPSTAENTDSAQPAKIPEPGNETSGIEDPVRQTFRGKKLPKQDDLKIVEGIGPKIEELCRAAGIETWLQLSEATNEQLKEILREAGPRFQMHSPDTWPAQARLAAEGEWQDLENYQDHLQGGREPGKD